MNSQLGDYDFDLPANLIAQRPLQDRDSSDLLVAPPGQSIERRRFYEIIEYFLPGDVLVLNDSKVFKYTHHHIKKW